MALSRRQFLVNWSSAAAALSLSDLPAEPQGRFFPHRPKPPAPPAQPFVFFGTDTAHPDARGIYLSRFNPATGQLTAPHLAAEAVRPAFFALGQLRARRMLYVTNEGDDRTSTISTFSLDSTGALKLLGEVSSGASGPCFLSLDAAGQSAYVANYAGSGIATFRIQPDGTLSPPVERIDFRSATFGRPGPRADRQDAPHPHSAMLSPDNRFLIVNDLGNDTIVTFPVDPASARLGPPHLNQVIPAGSGPRHIAIHPNGRWLYGIEELDSRIDQFLWNATHSAGAHAVAPQAFLTDAGHPVSTVDPGFHGTNTAAEILISSDGHFVYASNRGENSLVVFSIDQASGALTPAQRIPCGGKGPRHFTLDPTGAWLVCGNQDSSSVTVFARKDSSGQLSGPVQTLAVPSPMFTLFA